MIPDFIVSSYVTIPNNIDPIAFSMGFLKVRWYSLMYIVAFLVVYALLSYRIKKKETIYETNLVSSFLIYAMAGVLAGGRLGYVLFYNFSYYYHNILEIILPFKISCFLIHASCFEYFCIYGMSYHGGLIGVILATWYFTRKNKVDFLKWAEFAVPAVPAGFFFGRIGNFLNGELYGRITTGPWGMYFPSGGEVLRHPSQLYEAFFEGLVLFIILWSIRNGIKHKGKVFHVSYFMLYVFLYALFRFFLEFFREPDSQLGFILKWGKSGLTMGQIFSLGMLGLATALLFFKKDKKVV